MKYWYFDGKIILLKECFDMAYQGNYKGTEVFLEAGRYGNGQNAIQFMDESGIPQFVATVAIEDELEINELAIKNYSENEGVLDWLIEKGIVQQPHRYVTSGFVMIPICNLTTDAESIFW